MKAPEILKSNEQIQQEPKHINAIFQHLDANSINTLFEQRQKQLQDLKPLIALKFYYEIEEKLQKERQTMLDMLEDDKGAHKMMEKYSNILDPQYFEQKFINATN